jgi:hypothetical protein
VQVRTELTHCSVGGKLLAKRIRLEGDGLIADAGPDQLLECTDSSGALAMLDGTGSDDPQNDPMTFLWTAPGIVFDDTTSPTPSATFPKATTTVTLEVSAGEETDTDTVVIEVADTVPPEVTCPPDAVVECGETGGTPSSHPTIAGFLAGANAQEACDAAPVLTNDAPEFFELGETVVTFTAADADGNSGSCQATVTVEDTAPPTLELSVSPALLRPPNHKMRDITAEVRMEDVCDSEPTFVLTDVSSNEPDNGTGDGHTTADIAGAELDAADTSFQVRAERSGSGVGRIYTVTYTASDASDNSATETAHVIVEKSAGNVQEKSKKRSGRAGRR